MLENLEEGESEELVKQYKLEVENYENLRGRWKLENSKPEFNFIASKVDLLKCVWNETKQKVELPDNYKL